MVSLGELYDERLRAGIVPRDPSSDALKHMMISILNHFQYKETNADGIEEFIIDIWSEKVKNAISTASYETISWKYWKSFFYYVLSSSKRNDKLRANRPEMEPKELCEYSNCEHVAEEWDHILPHFWGGPSKEWNYKHLCRLHNRMKGSSLSMFVRMVKQDKDYFTSFYQWIIKELYY